VDAQSPFQGMPMAILATAIAFGVAHAYQGPLGVLATGTVGLILGFIVWSTGSLVPAIVIHSLIDLRNVALPSAVIESVQYGTTQAGAIPRIPQSFDTDVHDI